MTFDKRFPEQFLNFASEYKNTRTPHLNSVHLHGRMNKTITQNGIAQCGFLRGLRDELGEIQAETLAFADYLTLKHFQEWIENLLGVLEQY